MKSEPFLQRKLIIGLAFFDFLLIDQATKFFARYYLEEPINILPFFKLLFVENTGVAFSFPLPSFLIIFLGLAVLAFLGQQFFTQPLSPLVQWSYVLIAAGALGNLIDRFLFGAVTDFLSFWSFPIFNFADTWISLGVVCFLLSEIYTKKQTPKGSL